MCSPQRKVKRRVRKDRIALTVAVIVFFVAGLVYAFFGGDEDFGFQPSKLSSVFMGSKNGKINVLVLGVDEREDDVGRSDTTFVITIDTAAKKVTMLSIPRDTRVKITGHGWDKINHAYAFSTESKGGKNPNGQSSSRSDANGATIIKIP